MIDWRLVRLVILNSLNAVDASTTAVAVASGAIELNPIVAGSIDTFGIPATMIAKIALVAGASAWIEKSLCGEINAAFIGFYVGVCLHNLYGLITLIW